MFSGAAVRPSCGPTVSFVGTDVGVPDMAGLLCGDEGSSESTVVQRAASDAEGAEQSGPPWGCYRSVLWERASDAGVRARAAARTASIAQAAASAASSPESSPRVRSICQKGAL